MFPGSNEQKHAKLFSRHNFVKVMIMILCRDARQRKASKGVCNSQTVPREDLTMMIHMIRHDDYDDEMK